MLNLKAFAAVWAFLVIMVNHKVSYILYAFVFFVTIYINWSSAFPLVTDILGKNGESPSDLRKLLVLGTVAGLLTNAG